MVTDTTIPKGYKQTDIGVIPEDWQIKKFGKLGSFYKGKGISSKDLVSDGLPCIMYGDIYVKFDTKFSNPDSRITKQTAANSSLAKTGNLFFTGSGETAEEIGKCVVYEGNDDIYIGGDIIAFTPNSDHDSLFLAYMQNSKMLLSQKANLGQGHTVVHIYTEHIKSLKMPLPPTKTEQTAIASVLSDVDTLINSLEKLITKKRDIKQGTMQELLTGKRRLPGFSGEWLTKKLGEVVEIKTGKKDVNEGNPNGEFPFFTCSRENTFSDHYSFDCEAILIAGNGEVGNLHYYIGKFEAYQRTYVLQNFTVNTKFLWYQLDAFLKKSLGIGTVGTSIPYIKRGNLFDFTFSSPKNPEEQAIVAAALSDMDAEISTLEQKLAKYRLLKQGMMQVLLIGKVRLI